MSDVDHEKEQLYAGMGVHTGSIENEHAHAMKNSGGGGGGCFPKGTEISTPGGVRDISTLRAGDVVITVDPKDQTRHMRKILKHLSHSNKKVWLLQFADGSSIRTTGIHSFFVKDAWHMARNIAPGDTITYFESNGTVTTKVVECSHETKEAEDVYNIIVEGSFSFLADGILVHSFTYFKTVRAMAWTCYAFLKQEALPKEQRAIMEGAI